MSTANPQAGRNHERHHEDIAEVQGDWTLFLGAGVLTILLGFALIVSSFMLTDAIALVFGWIILMAGVIELATSYVGRRWIGAAAAVLNGVLYCGIGITLFSVHFGDVSGVMLAVAGLVFTAGLFRAGLAILKSFTHREITLFNGAVGMLIGLMIGAAWYGAQTWAIGLLLGIEVVITGAAWVIFAVVLKRERQGASQPSDAH